MRRGMIGLVFGAAWTLLIVAQVSSGEQEASVSVPEGWIQLPADGATTASAFIVVKNPTMYDIYLISAAAEVADSVEFRDADVDGAKTLREVTVPAYGSVKMQADGVHLQLMSLERPLKEGETIPLTLTTDGAVKLRVQAPVRVAPK